MLVTGSLLHPGLLEMHVCAPDDLGGRRRGLSDEVGKFRRCFRGCCIETVAQHVRGDIWTAHHVPQIGAGLVEDGCGYERLCMISILILR